ncbi:TIGR03085 family metal-binding protein [Nocardioides sp.]|uniref:TIGR03085 family metal-binding protein n=1 Tax=Nocardioides sp. TaxID=35761 RepID=UPI002732B2D7|nr:TIGR03085 family metal-binding protein [Nocardioides sp.]MDP3892401.1 TIGR03085 family metal-binding protein [Nocardioides sp.]
MTSFARAERHQLCDLALVLGGSAPTLCGEWDVKQLVVHLLVRERSLVGSPGIVVPALSGLTERVSQRMARADLPLLVDQLRHPRLAPAAIGPLDRLMNTAEFFVHHEDIRRAQQAWKPRELSSGQETALWKLARSLGKGLVRGAGVPVVIEDSRTGAKAVLRRDTEAVVISGLPSEILLYLYGRQQVTDLDISGPEDAVRRLRGADRGI